MDSTDLNCMSIIKRRDDGSIEHKSMAILIPDNGHSVKLGCLPVDHYTFDEYVNHMRIDIANLLFLYNDKRQLYINNKVDMDWIRDEFKDEKGVNLYNGLRNNVGMVLYRKFYNQIYSKCVQEMQLHPLYFGKLYVDYNELAFSMV